ncbi:frizzled-4-like, partial [Tropilaelaps mercedesae]
MLRCFEQPKRHLTQAVAAACASPVVPGMPNYFGHEAQEEARQNYMTFSPLIKYGCSSQLVFFLCSVYVPMCTDKVPNAIGPCRPLCESVRSSCEPTLQDFGFSWPDQLNCSSFPLENNGDDMCMEGPAPETAAAPVAPPPRKSVKRPGGARKSASHWNRHAIQCGRYRHGERAYAFVNATERCGQLCDSDVLFSADNKRFAEIWMAVWSVVCFMTSAFTVLLFVMDRSQFEIPDRAVVYLCLCYCAQSVGYFIRLLLGRGAASCYREGGVAVLVHQGLHSYYCSSVFGFIYYFSNAASMWWVVITISWFMCQPLRYPAHQVRKQIAALHCAAWILPAFMTAAILAMRAVDAEELTGVCFVGNQNRDTLLAFVILPQTACLLTGCAFLVSGAVTLYGTRQSAVAAVKGYSEWSYLASRAWIFALLYVIPASCVLGVNIYEYINRDAWTLAQSGPIVKPDVECYIFKMFMSVVVGITAGLWTWCSKAPQMSVEPESKTGAPPLLVTTPYAHQPVMVQNQYFLPEH